LRGALLSADARLRAKADATQQSILALARMDLLTQGGSCKTKRVRLSRI
jgi:hypothetical protein